MNKKELIVLIILISSLLSSCATRYGKLSDGKEYKEYDVHFDKESGRFYILFNWTEGENKEPIK